VEIIAVILFVVLVIAGAGNKNKKKGSAAEKPRTNANAPRQTPASESRAVQRVRPVSPVSALAQKIDAAIEALDKQLESAGQEVHRHSEPVIQAMNRATPQGASMLDDADCAGGSMPHTHVEGHSALADEDCVGGSMEHTHTEGVSRATQARRMAAIDAAESSDVLPETIDARALRRAVVMAEVLGKPRALRKYQ
jgi:Tfp pilus assembly protein FimV